MCANFPLRQISLRVLRHTVMPNLEVEMRAGRPASAAAVAEQVTLIDRLSAPDSDGAEVTVAGDEAIAVVEFYQNAIPTVPPCYGHYAAVCSV